jgi:predicted negative regulator of RcsB-dependent stress response
MPAASELGRPRAAKSGAASSRAGHTSRRIAPLSNAGLLEADGGVRYTESLVPMRRHSNRQATWLALMLLPMLGAGCSAPAPPPRPAPLPPVARAARPTPTATPEGAAEVRHQMLEESNVGEAPGLTPAPEAVAVAPTPGLAVEQLAALPSPVIEGAPKKAASAEPESLLGLINRTTPPNVAAALRLIEEGRQHVRQGHVDQALDRFERAVAIDPTNAYGYYFLAQLHYLNKNYDQAIAFASRAAVLSARVDPTWLARVYSLEGAAFEDVGRYPDARKAYEKAVQADPNNLAGRVGVARLTPTD